jgi:flagellar basal-body rod modification protein FlgD
MSVSGVSGTSSSSLTGSRDTIAENFDNFLSLLTTQLKHQNPLDPMDTNQFTQQLVQFTAVEQQLKTNDFLEAMMMSAQSAGAAEVVSYIGKDVTASGTTSDLKDGRAMWLFNLEEASDSVTVTVKDQAGNTVFTQEGTLPAGNGQFIWDGVATDGTVYTSGYFTMSVDARDADGGYINVTTEMGGTVTGVDLSGSEPVLLVGEARIALSSITSVRAVSNDSSTDEDDETEGTDGVDETDTTDTTDTTDETEETDSTDTTDTDGTETTDTTDTTESISDDSDASS